MSTSGKLLTLLGISMIGVLVYRFGYLRMPERNIPNDNSLLVSPANGTVIAVRPYSCKQFTELKNNQEGAIQIWTDDVDRQGTIISIALNITNVHYQRAPACSSIVSMAYTEGRKDNALALLPGQIIKYTNENNQILFKHVSGFKYKVVQIAGFFARRINHYLEPGQQVNQGEVIGVIKFGSQVTVIVPRTVKVTVKAGDYLVDGETVIAKLNV